jgi:hypothetical protein
MSEFTDGVLFLNQHIEIIKTLQLDYWLHTLNNRWSAMLFPDFESWHEPRISDLKALSKECPLLNFQHGGDHGWGYQIVDKGNIVAWVDVNYELAFNMKVTLAEARYPNEADIFIFWEKHPEIADALQQEVEESTEYHQRVERMYAHKHVEAFDVFEVDASTIEKLGLLLSAEAYYDDMLGQVETFKRLLGFAEMTWVSYHYSELD